MPTNQGPSRIDRFWIRDVLSSQSQGLTYSASESRRAKRPQWVLKPIPWEDDGRLRRGLRADVLDLASLSHPSLGLPASFIRDFEGRRAFAVRPYVPGPALSALRGKTPRELLPWFVAAAEGLGVLHRNGYLHRNLKASNLFTSGALSVRPAKNSPVVLCDPLLERSPAKEGSVRQPGDRGWTSFASDLYDLGAVFYELLGGRRPEQDGAGFPTPLAPTNPAVPRDLDRLIRKLMHPEPEGRYQETRALIDDLRLLGTERTAVHLPLPDCFLGRGRELRQAARPIEDRGRPLFLAVAGEAGIGKSAFLRRLALEAQLAGYRTAQASCFPESVVPGGPLRAILDDLFPTPPPLLRRLPCAGLPSPGGTPDPRAFFRDLLAHLNRAAGGGPLMLLFDDAHLGDSTTVDFLTRLAEGIARWNGTEDPESPRPPSLVVSYRAESPFRAALDPLLRSLRSRSGGQRILELPGLPPEVVEKWLELTPFGGELPREGLKITAQLQGNPFAIRLAMQDALRAGSRATRTPRGARLSSVLNGWFSSLEGTGRALLEAIAVLGRPASLELLGSLSGLSPFRLRSALAALAGDGTLHEERGRYFFRHSSFQQFVLEALGEPGRKHLHGRVAAALRAGPDNAPEEVAHHQLLSEEPDGDLQVILNAARHLAASDQVRPAISFYQAFLQHLPQREAQICRQVSAELAEVHGRVGEYRRAAKILEDLAAGLREPREAGRIHGRLGVFLHRAGDPERGVFHLKRALSCLPEAGGPEWFRERLRVTCELAEIASNRGQVTEAEALCSQGLTEISQRGETGADVEVGRLKMILLETLAHLRLRQFRYQEARELFEKSLILSEDLEAGPEASLILNNLGILHIQQNRFPEAIRCYRRAEEIAARLGEDHILANIHSNLAVLYAKTGEPEAADHALRNAELRDASCDSDRVRFLLLHSSGLVDLILGRYTSAIERFRASIAFGEELKDRFVVAFDLVYLGECHLFRGEPRPARAAFRRALALAGGGSGVNRMVAARSEALAALSGRKGRAQEAPASSSGIERGEARVPFLEAWDDFFIGWAWRLQGRPEPAQDRLTAALGFFSDAKIPGGEIQCVLELAALDLDRGRPARAAKRLAALRTRFNCGRGPLGNPMLCSRLLAYQARAILEGKSPDAEKAMALLVEAESFLIGRQLRDLEALVSRLWAKAGSVRSVGTGFPATAGPGDPPAPRGREEGRGGPGGERIQIIGQSPPVLELLNWIRRAAVSKLPVLITGETGVGKDLVASAIHYEGPRRSSPFISLNCAAVPEQLLEAELFGYRRGAFSGAEQDRDGLLLRAQGGTFFFDEIGELPSTLQGKILRVLDSSTLRPLGADSEIKVDARFLFATHQDLRALVKERRFRPDLLFRLAVLEIRVPSLRERIEDLPHLIRHFRSLEGGGNGPLVFEEAALGLLNAYSWPGNIRELRNVIARLVLTRSEREKVCAEDVHSLLREKPSSGLFSPAVLRSWHLDQLLSHLEREYLVLLHQDQGGALKAMADYLGITERALYKRFKALGIKPASLRRGS